MKYNWEIWCVIWCETLYAYIVKARKYFSIMQLVCFELSFSVRQTFGRFFSCFTNFLLLKVFQGLSVTQRLSPSRSRLTSNRLKGFFTKHIWIWEYVSYGSRICLKNLSDVLDKRWFWYGVLLLEFVSKLNWYNWYKV